MFIHKKLNPNVEKRSQKLAFVKIRSIILKSDFFL